MRSVPDAIILCGGAGTRVRSLTSGPKAMMLVGGRPFLEALLRQLRRWGIQRAVLAVGYGREAIQSHFGSEAFGVEIIYSPEDVPLGTGGALRQASEQVRTTTAIVLNGDSYTAADLDRFMRQHGESNADMSVLVVAPDGRDDCGTVSLDASGRLLAFQEKQLQAGPQYINAGIYLFSRETLLAIPQEGQVSLEKELFPRWLAEGKQIRAVIDAASCHDIGTPERYESAQTVLAEVAER